MRAFQGEEIKIALHKNKKAAHNKAA